MKNIEPIKEMKRLKFQSNLGIMKRIVSEFLLNWWKVKVKDFLTNSVEIRFEIAVKIIFHYNSNADKK